MQINWLYICNQINKYSDNFQEQCLKIFGQRNKSLKFIKSQKYNKTLQFFCRKESRIFIDGIGIRWIDSKLYSSKLSKFQNISEQDVKPYIKQLVDAISYLHNNSIVHRDIKLENILYSKGEVKLADFGYASIISNSRRSFCGTLDYIAPEMVQNQIYNEKVDVWAIGVVIFELLTGKSPFYHKSQSITYVKIIEVFLQFKNDFQMPENFSKQLQDLLRKIFILDPKIRISIDEMKFHQWLS